MEFPLDGLDLREYLASSRREELKQSLSGDDGTIYDLYCVVHHVGALSGGHYVTTVRDTKTGGWEELSPRATIGTEAWSRVTRNRSGSGSAWASTWKLFNDNVVNPIAAEEARGSTAYLLFYQKRGGASSLSHAWNRDEDVSLSASCNGTTLDNTNISEVSEGRMSTSHGQRQHTPQQRGFTEEEFEKLMLAGNPSINSLGSLVESADEMVKSCVIS